MDIIIDKKKLDLLKTKLEMLQTDLFYAISLINELYLKAETDKEKSIGKIAFFKKPDDEQ